MDIKKILKPLNSIGSLWCTGVRPVYEYVDGHRTDRIIGYKYTIVAVDMDAERLDVKILGDKQLDVGSGHVTVKLDDPEWVIWTNDYHAVVVSARATGIHPVIVNGK